MKKLYLFLLLSVLPVYGFLYADSNKQPQKIKQEVKAGENTEDVPYIAIAVDKSEVNVGDIVDLTITYKLPEGSSFNGAGSNGSKSDGFELEGLEGLTVVSKKAENGDIKLKVIIDKVQPFKIGPVTLTFKDKNDELNIIKSEEIDINVKSNLGDKPAEARLKPIEDIFPTYPVWLRILPYALIALGALAVIAGLLYWNKRRSRQKQILSEIKLPHVVAREELKKLVQLKLIEKGRYKDFYFRFSEILRIYIERLRSFPAAEMTSEEIIKKIRDERDRQLIPLLRDSDLVKFADMVPTTYKIEEDIKSALRYIKDTTPVETVVEHRSGVME